MLKKIQTFIYLGTEKNIQLTINYGLLSYRKVSRFFYLNYFYKNYNYDESI